MIVATLIGLAALAQPAPASPLRGVVVERGTGRPLAGVTVRVDREPDEPFAVTDDQGRFAGLPTTYPLEPRVDGEGAPTCWVRAWDVRAWAFRVDNPGPVFRGDPKPDRARAVAALSWRAEPRWRGNGADAALAVECPPVGTVEVAVRGPDGAPLADRPVVLLPRPPSGAVPEGASISGRTDGAGVARIALFEGFHRFAVRAPAVGFGGTGVFEVIGGKVARVEMPPLARFARVEGRLAPALVTPGTEVALDAGGLGHGARPSAPCDEAGRFAIADVVPGSYQVVAVLGAVPVRAAYRWIRAEPGRTLADVVLEPPTPVPPGARPEQDRPRRPADGGRNRPVPWAEGTIRDERGAPVPGASVQLVTQIIGGQSVYEKWHNATSDREGRYRFEGPPLPWIGTLMVLATAPGRPPAVAFAPVPPGPDPVGGARPARVDLALGAAGSGAALAVLVTKQGRPIPGVPVHLSTQATGPSSAPIHGYPMFRVGQGEFDGLLIHRAVTGVDGVARFANLLPGSFLAVASGAPDPELDPAPGQLPGPIRERQPWTGRVGGIVVPPGGRGEVALALHRPSHPVRFRVLRPDGSPAADRKVALTAAQGPMGRPGPLRLDGAGVGTLKFDRMGFWSVRVQLRDAAGPTDAIDDEPAEEAEALIPVSPIPAVEGEVTLRVARREPASLRVRLVDAAGRPARGTVTVSGGRLHEVDQAGTTDADGVVRFAGLTPGPHRVGGVVAGGAAPPLQSDLPEVDDAALRDRVMVFDRDLTLAPGVEAEVELREQPVGYIRAAVRAPAGLGLAKLGAHLFSAETPRIPGMLPVDPATGAVRYGPVRPGRWSLRIQDESADSGRPVAEGEVVVEPGRVAVADLAIPGPWMTATGLLRPEPGGFAATVVLPDGSTPAYAARGLFFPAGWRIPAAEAVADGSGRLSWTWSSWDDPPGPDPGAGLVPEAVPTVVAWLPGGAGAVVAKAEAGKPLRLVLPGAGGASGRLTRKGGAFDAGDSLVRVVATPEGRSAVIAELAREAVPDREGRFRFAGIAAGRYAVQASRDGIWLSRPVPLVVEPGKEAEPVELELPDPGVPVALNLVDRDGRPRPRLDFTVSRPGGPLAAALSPGSYRTDDRGVAVVRGLPAGPQTLVAADDPTPHTFQVPPLRPGPGPTAPQALRVEVPRPSP